MDRYPEDVEQKMTQFANWLSEKDRRRYAAIEALKLDRGGIDYIAHLFGCDPKTIRQGMQDLEQPEDAAAGRVRKKGGTPAVNRSPPLPGAEPPPHPGGVHRRRPHAGRRPLDQPVPA